MTSCPFNWRHDNYSSMCLKLPEDVRISLIGVLQRNTCKLRNKQKTKKHEKIKIKKTKNLAAFSRRKERDQIEAIGSRAPTFFFFIYFLLQKRIQCMSSDSIITRSRPSSYIRPTFSIYFLLSAGPFCLSISFSLLFSCVCVSLLVGQSWTHQLSCSCPLRNRRWATLFFLHVSCFRQPIFFFLFFLFLLSMAKEINETYMWSKKKQRGGEIKKRRRIDEKKEWQEDGLSGEGKWAQNLCVVQLLRARVKRDSSARAQEKWLGYWAGNRRRSMLFSFF